MAPQTPSARHATPPSGLAGTGRAGTPRRLQDSLGTGLAGTPRRLEDSPGTGLACRQRAGHDGPLSARARRAALQRAVIPAGHNGPLPNGPSSQRARHARRIQSDAHHPQPSPWVWWSRLTPAFRRAAGRFDRPRRATARANRVKNAQVTGRASGVACEALLGR